MCKQDGCVKEVFANGLCHAHYDADRLERADECNVEGCGNKSHAKGLCNKHYRLELQKNKPECGVEGCKGKIIAHGLCDKHRIRLAQHGHLKSTRADDWGKRINHPLYESWCNFIKMSNLKGISEEWKDFWVFVKDVGEKPSKNHCIRRIDIYGAYGKDNFEWVESKPNQTKAEYARNYYKNNPDKAKNSRLRSKYGITLIDFNRMLVEQNGVCKICKKEGKNNSGSLNVDHCHGTSKVRGLLCAGCNTAIGLFYEDVGTMKNAITYLNEHEAK